MIFCTLTGPDPRAFDTSRRGAEVGKPLRNGGIYFLGKRRTRTLEGECCFVNGTSVSSRLVTADVTVEPFHFSRYVDEQVPRYNYRKDADPDAPILKEAKAEYAKLQ